MGFFASLFGRSDDDEQEVSAGEALGPFPELYRGMTLTLETNEGREILIGQVSEYSAENRTLALERLPGGLSFETREIGSSVLVRGVNESMMQFYLKGTVQESNRLTCRLKDVQEKAMPQNRQNFRVQISVPATMYYESDDTFKHPEECTLVDISTGGACVESEYLHAEDEVLRMKVKLLDYAPMEFIGEIIRVTEYKPGKFRYGFLFAQLKERELDDLTRTLYNIQAGNRMTRQRSDLGHW